MRGNGETSGLKFEIMTLFAEVSTTKNHIVGEHYLREVFDKRGYSYTEIEDALRELYEEKRIVAAEHPLIDRGVWYRLPDNANNASTQKP